ncbi:MAG: hypothetical protein ACE145_00855 [Terriglobia bacterium]
MAQSTQLGDHALPRDEARPEAAASGSAWEKFKRGFVRAIFWSYERGSWQYDVIVLAILAFIFLSPRAWFQDRPTLQLTDLRHVQGFVEVAKGKDTASYLVDARLVEAQAPQKPEDAIREILRQRVQKPLTLKSMDPIRDRNHVLLGYTVVVAFE